jgi:hypothetical protein
MRAVRREPCGPRLIARKLQRVGIKTPSSDSPRNLELAVKAGKKTWKVRVKTQLPRQAAFQTITL